MENCLFTKLNGVVNNDELLKLGELRAQVLGGNGNIYIDVLSSKEITITDLDGNFITPAGENTVTGSVTVGVTVTENHRLSIISKYNILKIRGGQRLSVCLKDCMPIPSIAEITGRVYGDLADIIQKDSMTNFGSVGGDLSGNISNLSKFPNLEAITLNSAIEKISGDIVSWGGLTQLTTIITGSGCGSVNGTIESFVAGQRNAGRTSGSITCYYLRLTQITFNGEPMPNVDSATLSWDASTITYNGVTISA